MKKVQIHLNPQVEKPPSSFRSKCVNFTNVDPVDTEAVEKEKLMQKSVNILIPGNAASFVTLALTMIWAALLPVVCCTHFCEMLPSSLDNAENQDALTNISREQ